MTNSIVITSPIGPLGLRTDNIGLSLIDLRPTEPPGGPAPTDGVLRAAVDQLKAYFAGDLTVFDLPLSMHGTAFQRRVWTALLDIPYGETSSYGAVAGRIGRGTSPRAVGAANGQNPLPIVVPCHRVIGANGALVGYGGGLDTKRYLLELEARTTLRRGLFADLDRIDG